MSDCEWIAQVPHVKKATVSDALRSLMINEQMSEALVFLSESLICSFAHKKRAIWSKNLPKIVFLERFLKFFFIKRAICSFPQVTYQKWVMWANRSGQSPKMSKWANDRIACFLSKSLIRSLFAHCFAKNEQFTQENRWANSQPCE